MTNRQVCGRIQALFLVCGLALAAGQVASAQQQPPPGAPPQGGPPQGAPPFDMKPPPLRKGETMADGDAAGTPAPDGIGVAVSNTATAGIMDESTMTYVPWEDASVIRPPAVGDALPDGAIVRNAAGEAFDLNAAVASRPTVLIYYRGGWCPFCNAHLHQLQESVGALTDMGYQLLAVSTDTVEALQAYEENNELDYRLFSDGDLNLATKLGLKYKVVDEYIEHVKSLPPGVGFDLNERNGGYLVTPAALVLDTDGVIRFVYANNNYSVRVTQEALIEAARAALDN